MGSVLGSWRDSINANRGCHDSRQDVSYTDSLRPHVLSLNNTTSDAGFNLSFEDISVYKTSLKRHILFPASGTMHSGSFVGIMGPSGSGKTTLIKVLAGKVRPSSGAVYVNNQVSSHIVLRSLVAYVPQDDIILPDLTVREAILYSARIRIGGTFNDRHLQQYVDYLIASMGLQSVENHLVGDATGRSIPGGERKRVNIALELAAAPSTLVLDEPTSGLDANAALSVMTLLKRLSEQGLVVVCVIHQPRSEIFALLDRLLLLSDGKQVFLGSASASLNFVTRLGVAPCYKSSNPADTIIDAISNIHQAGFNALTDSDNYQDSIPTGSWVSKSGTERYGDSEGRSSNSGGLPALMQRAQQRRASWHKQAYLACLRGLVQQSRQVSSLALEITTGAITGLLIGLSNFEYKGHLFQGVFLPPLRSLSSATSYRLLAEQGMLCCLAIGCAAGPAGVILFAEDRLVLNREWQSGHSPSAFFLGKTISSIPRMAVSALHFASFYMLLTTPMIDFGQLFINCLLYFYCIYGLGCVVAALVRRQDAPVMAMLISLVFSALSGCAPRLATVNEWKLKWIWIIFPGVWFSEANFNENISPLSSLYDTKTAAETVGYTLNRTSTDLAMLLVIGTVYRIISYIVLVFSSRKNQS
ncbi:putative ABC transporter [Aspergillus japonicus CBS 114.51]|uniref:Putative ABC transporter n=1 Tax=Aspergillus japonicus CBS 114.51 TaxID=1448312 RepID=A0A8T8XDJ1_ASPJA|nr:putative ABC transporter [Aspergillus japonicus CBS 114.51]RAH86215.1 putative ABC transporter [Aspergillus japonicus CBS 114.51]